MSGRRQRTQPAAAVTLHNRATHLDGQAGQQPGVAGHTAAVFARLIGAANDMIVQQCGVYASLVQQLSYDLRQQVIRTDARQRPRLLAEGGT